jgi:hypothetical protein
MEKIVMVIELAEIHYDKLNTFAKILDFGTKKEKW